LLGGIKGSPAGVDLNNTQNQSGPQGAGANILITIQNKEYSTTLVAIHAGDSVTWKNLEDTRHFVLLSSITNSGALQKGQSWTYVFNQSGTYTFRDMDWPLMKGNITVS
jgi:plastocyanin